MARKQKPWVWLTHEVVRATFSYDPETGVIKRIAGLARYRTGKQAGWINNAGYWMVSVRGGCLLAHRLIWFYVTGKWPDGDIDHINRDRSDNRWINLRDVSHQVNQQNVGSIKTFKQKTSLVGANWDKSTKNWKACICVDGKNIHLGRFGTDVEAHKAYVAAKRRLHEGSML